MVCRCQRRCIWSMYCMKCWWMVCNLHHTTEDTKANAVFNFYLIISHLALHFYSVLFVCALCWNNSKFFFCICNENKNSRAQLLNCLCTTEVFLSGFTCLFFAFTWYSIFYFCLLLSAFTILEKKRCAGKPQARSIRIYCEKSTLTTNDKHYLMVRLHVNK